MRNSVKENREKRKVGVVKSEGDEAIRVTTTM